MTAFAAQAQTYVDTFNQYLDHVLQDQDTPDELLAAMRYSALAGGKRIRPLLVHASGLLFGAPATTVNAAAAAVELIHCYSLIHDDLPAMDDDDLRRGRPTLHKQYDEATAILAGDALQSLAFEVLSAVDLPWPTAHQAVTAMRLLARASGAAGMVGGQMLDIRAEGRHPAQHEVEHMFLLKTGALIRVSAELGLCAAAAPRPQDWDAITGFGNAIGQAFQIQDDVLDVVASSEELGKPQGSDAAKDKPNYALRFGLEAAQQRANGLYQEALACLAPYGEAAAPLRWMADYIIKRKK